MTRAITSGGECQLSWRTPTDARLAPPHSHARHAWPHNLRTRGDLHMADEDEGASEARLLIVTGSALLRAALLAAQTPIRPRDNVRAPTVVG